MNANKVRSLFTNDLWLNPNINSVGLDQFKEAEKIIIKLKDSEDKSEFKELCISDIKDNGKSPIIPRLLATLCGKHPLDDKYAFTVFDDYYHSNKWKEVDYLGNLLLSFGESSYVLKALAECYDVTNETDKKIAVWERLIKTDHTETDVFYKLAEYYTASGNDETALNYYKRVVQRHIIAQDLNAVKDALPLIMKFKQDNADYLIQLSSRIAKSMGNDKGVFFLNEIFENGNFDINSNIKILKKILEFSNNNKEATDKLISYFREKYSANPRLEYCLSNTGLLHNYIEANVAVEKFEKEIEFVEGAFVYHNTWKLGRIRKIEKDEMQIQFLSKKELHSMTCNMAFDSLKILPKQHILVLKAGATAEKIKEHLMGNIEWGIKMLLNSFNGEFTLKQVKSELVPSVLNDKEWTSWLSEAKKELSSNPYFGTSDQSNDIYVLRDTPITFEEKTLQIFSREKGFFNKYDILKSFIKKNGSTDSEEFVRIINYFENQVNSIDYTGLCSFLILDDFKNKKGMSFIKLEKTFKELYSELSEEQIKDMYSEMQDNDLRKLFINFVVSEDDNYSKVLTTLIHINPSSFIVENLSKKTMNNIRRNAVDNYQADPDFILWLLKETTDEIWANIDMTDEDIIILKLQLLLFVNSKIAHDVDNAVNKARSKQITDSLFANQSIYKFLGNCSVDSAKRIYSYSQNIPLLDEDKSIGVKHFILSNRKDADSIVGNVIEDIKEERIIPKGFLCTKAMFNAKTAELDHIMNVEIPENSKEIGTARDLGDLRENAEYQYAKDKQKNLNFMMNKLTDEIDIAKIIDPENVDINYVEFGTEVTFRDNINNKDVIYTILGPWESNPDKNILNFQAPLGLKIYNMTKGQNKKFEINGVKFDYTVKEIKLADFNIK